MSINDLVWKNLIEKCIFKF